MILFSNIGHLESGVKSSKGLIMIIVGEKINASRPSITEAVAKRDAHYVVRVARAQAQAGASFIDVNAGTFLDHEAEYLCWLVETIQTELDMPLCLGSSNPRALTEAMKRHKGEPMINSISMEEERFRSLLPVVTSRPCHVVALCMAHKSLPTTVEERVHIGTHLIEQLSAAGVPLEKIYIDPLVQPVAVDSCMGVATLGAIHGIMNAFPGVNTICGLSNVSFGLPGRQFVNRSFLTLAMAYGLSAAILDPTDKQLMATLLAVEMLLGRDKACERFIAAYQNGSIEA
jgi:cobalamin-dependent methionine synthase I